MSLASNAKYGPMVAKTAVKQSDESGTGPKKEIVGDELQEMWKKQSGETKERVAELSSEVQQLAKLMHKNREEDKKEEKAREIRYQGDRRKLEMELDAKLRKSEGRPPRGRGRRAAAPAARRCRPRAGSRGW